MHKRKITKIKDLKFKPFDKYGKKIKGWSWHKTVLMKKQILEHVSKLEPGTKTIPQYTNRPLRIFYSLWRINRL